MTATPASHVILAKYLHRRAGDELVSGHLYSAGLAVSLMQDAVEALAHQVAIKVQAKVGRESTFLAYWNEIPKKAEGQAFPFRNEMRELNLARVSFKHEGIVPNVADAERHFTASHRFFSEVALSFFKVEFDAVSEADLVADSNIRGMLKAAEAAIQEEDAKTALKRCSDALRLAEALIKAAVPVTERLATPPAPRSLPPGAGAWLEWTQRKFIAVEKGLALRSLGFSPAEYALLVGSLPIKSAGEAYHWLPMRFANDLPSVSRAKACIRIVIDLALRAERAQADIERLAKQAGLVGTQP